MQSSLKKSLYLGLAAVSFVAVAGTTSANASAKAAKTVSNVTMTTPAASRNVNLTGTNAIYSKPGTTKGAQVVATTTTASKIKDSKSGTNNFRAYRVAKTDRGSVYYKVVSFDGHYRGYIYGGKSDSAFAGGLVAYPTTKDATAPAASDVYSLNAATSTTANTLFFKEPAWTNYKVGRAKVDGKVLTTTDAYKDAKFTFNKAATTSREGQTWYQIASVNGSTTNGLVGAWVKASDVTAKAVKADDNNSITVNYVDASNHTVGTATFVTTAPNTSKGYKVGTNVDANNDNLYAFALNNLPKGYVAVPGSSPAKQEDALFGGTFNVNVTQGATSKVSFQSSNVINTIDGKGVNVENPLTPNTDITSQVAKNELTNAELKLFTGKASDTVDFAGLEGNLFDADKPLNTFYGKTTYYAGKEAYHYVFTYVGGSLKDASNGAAKYGNDLTARYAAQLTHGAANAQDATNNISYTK